MSNQEIKNIILENLKKNNASFVGIFGSFIRDEMTENSDIDVLVEFSGKVTLLDVIRIEQELSEQVGRKIDLVTRGAVYPKLWPYIQKDLKILFQ